MHSTAENPIRSSPIPVPGNVHADPFLSSDDKLLLEDLAEINLEDGDIEVQVQNSQIEEIAIAQQFIQLIRTASFSDEHDNMDPYYLDRLCNPPNEVLVIDNPDIKLSIKQFLSLSNASEDAYESTRQNIMERFPDCQMLSLHEVERLVANLSGIVPIMHDMCPNSCMAYTGPWKDREDCPMCGEQRYKPVLGPRGRRIVKQKFYTLPIGPQLQALWRSPEGGKGMKYRQN